MVPIFQLNIKNTSYLMALFASPLWQSGDFNLLHCSLSNFLVTCSLPFIFLSFLLSLIPYIFFNNCDVNYYSGVVSDYEIMDRKGVIRVYQVMLLLTHAKLNGNFYWQALIIVKFEHSLYGIGLLINYFHAHLHCLLSTSVKFSQKSMIWSKAKCNFSSEFCLVASWAICQNTGPILSLATLRTWCPML